MPRGDKQKRALLHRQCVMALQAVNGSFKLCIEPPEGPDDLEGWEYLRSAFQVVRIESLQTADFARKLGIAERTAWAKLVVALMDDAVGRIDMMTVSEIADTKDPRLLKGAKITESWRRAVTTLVAPSTTRREWEDAVHAFLEHADKADGVPMPRESRLIFIEGPKNSDASA